METKQMLMIRMMKFQHLGTDKSLYKFSEMVV